MPSVILVLQWALWWFGISITLQCFVHFCCLFHIPTMFLRVWSLAKFIFLKSEREELKKLFGIPLAIQTELNTSLQELFIHSVSVFSITFWHVESTSQRLWQRSGCDTRSSKKKNFYALTMVFKRKKSRLECIKKIYSV